MIQPTYYDNFTCIASDCPFTCCQQWRIAVDEDTLSKWKQLGIPNMTQKDDAGVSIDLNTDGFCPFFNERGLCNIVLSHGEESISNTCHTFPREEHEFKSVTEKTLALGCPAVVDLLWKCEKFDVVDTRTIYDESICSDGNKSNKQLAIDTNNNIEVKLFYIRNRLIDFICNNDYPLGDSIKMLFYILLSIFDRYEEEDSEDFLICDYIDSYFEGPFLDDLYEQIAQLVPEYADNIYEQNELLLDIADTYRKKGMYADVLEPLCRFASDLEEDAAADAFSKERTEFESVWSGLEDKVRLIVAEEIYSTLFLPEGDLYSMVLKLQWLGMTYAVLKQMLFISWKMSDCKLEYEQIRQILCVLIRMTGYSEEDIEEYLENSFEDIIWDWGYMNLII